MNSFFKSIVFIILCFTISNYLPAQNIAINSSGNPGNAATILDLSDVSNSSLGLALPNVDILNVNSASPIISPPTGLIVWNTNNPTPTVGGFGAGFYYWSGSGWLYIANSGIGPDVTSVGLTGPGGIVGITNTNGNPITSLGSFGITTTGTSGGIPYFSSGSVLSSSALLTQNGIVLGGGAGAAPTTTAALTNGQVLIGSTGNPPVPATITAAANSGISVTNGAGSITIGTNGVLNNIVTIFNGTTSYTPSPGTKAIQVELIGAGGGGGGTSGPPTNCSAGGGGGSGGYVKFMIANPVGPYTVAVGGGGNGGVGAAGSGGGSTTFNTGATTYTAGGGSGGAKGSANNAAIGGAGGTNVGGATVGVSGNPGGTSVQSGTTWGVSGQGGGAVLGGGGLSISLAAAGGPITGNPGAANSGAGGSGGIVVGGSTAANGGAGAAGIIIITEYK